LIAPLGTGVGPHLVLTVSFDYPMLVEKALMADMKDKIEDKIDQGAAKAKDVTEKAVDKSKEAAKAAGKKIEEAGRKIKDQGK
jgi:hypothetical protein